MYSEEGNRFKTYLTRPTKHMWLNFHFKYYIQLTLALIASSKLHDISVLLVLWGLT